MIKIQLIKTLLYAWTLDFLMFTPGILQKRKRRQAILTHVIDQLLNQNVRSQVIRGIQR